VQEHGSADGDEKPCDCQVCEPIARDVSRRDDSKDKSSRLIFGPCASSKKKTHTLAMMMARVTNQKLRRRMWPVRGRGTIDRPFYVGKVVVPTGKAGVGKGIFPAKYKLAGRGSGPPR